MTCCGCGRGCSDFSSRQEQLPSIVAIDVVESILTQAVVNSARRVGSGMSVAELEAADKKLIDWLGATFSGTNAHFATGEDWNPTGLAAYVRDTLSEQILELLGTVSEDDEEIVYASAAVFVHDVHATIDDLAKSGSALEGIEMSPACRRLVGFWSRLLTGAPAEILLN